MRIAFAGTPEVAIPSLDALLAAGLEVVAVITRPDAPAGRGRRLLPSPVALHAEAKGLPVWKPARPIEVAGALEAAEVDAVAVVAYGALIPSSMLSIPRLGWINLHFSLLPAWRGAAPVQWAVIAGDDVTGACTFRLEEGLDTGPVLGSLTRPIASTDTAGTLLDALASDGAQLLAQTLLSMERLTPVPQRGDDVSLAPKLTKADARIVWSHPALAIDRRVRGCTPEPGAWTEAGEQRVVLGPVSLRTDVTELAPGNVRSDGRAILVGTGSHAVALGRVKPAGRDWMDADAWWRGTRGITGFDDATR